MKIQTLPDRLRIGGITAEDGRLLGAIPGARWNKSMMSWDFPRSPFTAARLAKLAHQRNWPVAADANFSDLLTDMERISAAEKWKREPAAAVAEQVASHMNGFHTATHPWRHQLMANAFANEMRATYLALDMGTGKTLVALNQIFEHDARTVLILCPKSVLDVWLDEFRRHVDPADMPRIVALTKGTAAERAEELAWVNSLAQATGERLVVLVNYDIAWRGELGEAILERTWDLVVADELHRCKAVSGKIAKWMGKLGKHAKRRLGLSGTPIPNNILDVWSQFRFLDRGVFGDNFIRFRARYAVLGGYGGHEVIEWRHEDELKRLLDLVTFRVDKGVLDLPSTMDAQRYCVLDEEAGRVYRDLEEQFIADVETGVVTASNALTRLLRLQQVTSGFATTEAGDEAVLGKHKYLLLRETLEDIDPSETVVVFCRFRHDLEAVQHVASDLGRPWGELSGSQNDLEGGRIPEGIKILGVQIQAGGLGVNLIAARYCIFYSVGFSLADYEQARARLHRGGQTEHVTYIHLIAQGTVDEKVYAALDAKREVVEEIMSYIKRGGA